MTLRLHKFLLIGIFLFAIIVILLLIFINFSPSTQTPSDSPTPTSLPLDERGTSQIKATSVNPPEDTSGTTILNPSQKIEYTLNQTSISSKDVSVRVSPSIPVKIRQSTDGKIEVFPDPPYFWKPDVLYKVTLFDKDKQIITTYSIKVPRIKLPDVVD